MSQAFNVGPTSASQAGKVTMQTFKQYLNGARNKT